MNKLLFAAAGMLALGLSAPASAADMAARPYTKAPPMVATAYDWTGFYIGANGGGGWARDCRNNVTTVTFLGCYDPSGAVAGGQVGYRWQSAQWVFGLEAQGDWSDIHGTTQNLGNAANSLSTKIDAFGLFTGQIGYAWNSALLYVKGGAAVVDQRFDFISNATGAAVASVNSGTRWGGTVGAGIEYGFAPNWSVGVEYDHIFLNRHDVTFVATATGLPLAATYNSGGDVDLATIRVNYRFGGAVIPRY
ncbi:outer membrane protein [Bradyrhizobium sp. USDA 3650]